ncbi:MAG: YbhB/YbcL family Raf kinase inhibitor-like protein, partial [Myxococcota bacterium]
AKAIEGRNDYGVVGFGGACPPPGEVHRYRFTVYALDVATLGLDASASAALIGFNLNAHALSKASITAVYNR